MVSSVLEITTVHAQIVRAALPLGKGIILNPFIGSGSTIADASALKLQSVGLEVTPEYFELAAQAIPKLSQLKMNEVRVTNGKN